MEESFSNKDNFKFEWRKAESQLSEVDACRKLDVGALLKFVDTRCTWGFICDISAKKIEA